MPYKPESIVDLVGRILADAALRVRSEGFVDRKSAPPSKFIINKPDLTHRHGICEPSDHAPSAPVEIAQK